MKTTPHSITVANAQSKGYAPCKVCNPYGLAGTSNNENQDNTTNPLIYIICSIILVLVIYLIYNDKKFKK